MPGNTRHQVVGWSPAHWIYISHVCKARLRQRVFFFRHCGTFQKKILYSPKGILLSFSNILAPNMCFASLNGPPLSFCHLRLLRQKMKESFLFRKFWSVDVFIWVKTLFEFQESSFEHVLAFWYEWKVCQKLFSSMFKRLFLFEP